MVCMSCPWRRGTVCGLSALKPPGSCRPVLHPLGHHLPPAMWSYTVDWSRMCLPNSTGTRTSQGFKSQRKLVAELDLWINNCSSCSLYDALCTTVQKFVVSKIFFKEIILFSNNALNWLKVIVKIVIILRKMSYLNKYCSFEFCIHQTILEKNVPLFPQKNNRQHIW